MNVDTKFFMELHDAIASKPIYDLGSQMAERERGIVLIEPTIEYQIEDVTFPEKDISRHFTVSLTGYAGKHLQTPGAKAMTLSPEELMRRVTKPFTPVGVRMRLNVIQLFLKPAIDVVVSKESPWLLELGFPEFKKHIILSPSCLKQ